MKVALCFAAAIFCSASSYANTAEELIEQLRSELKAEMKAAALPTTGKSAEGRGAREDSQRLYRLQEVLTQVQRASSADEGDVTLQQTVEALGASALSEKVQSLCQQLATELRAAQEKREQTLAAELEKTFSEALRTALAGKSAKDIDAPLMAVTKLSRENNNRSSTRNAGCATCSMRASSSRSSSVNGRITLPRNKPGTRKGRGATCRVSLVRAGISPASCRARNCSPA